MERQQVSSSSIASIGYEEETETLEIEFNSGSVYQYFGVPLFLYEQLMGAPSHGIFLNSSIKNHYGYEMVG